MRQYQVSGGVWRARVTAMVVGGMLSLIPACQLGAQEKENESRPYHGFYWNGKFLRGVMRVFDDRAEAEKFAKSRPPITGSDKVYATMGPAGPYDVSGKGKRWTVISYEYVDLIPPGYEERLSLPEDQEHLKDAWAIANLEISTGPDGNPGGPRHITLKQCQFKQIGFKGEDVEFSRAILQGRYGYFAWKYRLYADSVPENASELDVMKVLALPLTNVGDYAIYLKDLAAKAKAFGLTDGEHLRPKVRDRAFVGWHSLTYERTDVTAADRIVVGDREAYRLRVDYANGGHVWLWVNQNTDRSWHEVEDKAAHGSGAEYVKRIGHHLLGMGTVAYWRSGKHIVEFRGNEDQLKKVLAKHPSELPADSAFDRTRWAKRNVDYALADMARLIAEGSSEPCPTWPREREYENRYIVDILRWFDIPIVATRWQKWTGEMLRRHHTEVSKYWKEMRAEAKLRPRRNRTPVLTSGERVYSKFVEKHGRQPNYEELQQLYMELRRSMGYVDDGAGSTGKSVQAEAAEQPVQRARRIEAIQDLMGRTKNPQIRKALAEELVKLGVAGGNQTTQPETGD